MQDASAKRIGDPVRLRRLVAAVVVAVLVCVVLIIQRVSWDRYDRPPSFSSSYWGPTTPPAGG